MPLAEQVSILKELCLTAASLIGIYVAVSGLSTWKRQLRGAVEYDLARRLLRLAYQLRDGFMAVRDPFMHFPDFARPADIRRSLEQDVYASTLEEYKKRLKVVSELGTTLEAELLESEVLWGPKVKREFAPLFTLKSILHFAVRSHMKTMDPSSMGEMFRMAADIDTAERNRRIARAPMDELDEFARDVDAALARIDEALKGHLRK